MPHLFRIVALLIVAALGQDAPLVRTGTDASPTPDTSTTLRGERLESAAVARFDGSVQSLPRVAAEMPGSAKGHPRRRPPGFVPLSALSSDLDPVVQREAGPVTTSVTFPLLNFDGLSTAVHPQDSVGDAGPNHYVQMGNASTGGASVAVWTKTGAFVVDFKMQDLWIGAGGPCAAGLGDGIVLYDELADRWLLAQPSSTLSRMCFAVSQTPDPTTAYYLYEFSTASLSYPKVGIWPDTVNDGYFATADTATGTWIAVFERSSMLAGGAAGSFGTVMAALPGQNLAVIMPADLDGPPPPAGSPNYYYRQVDGDIYGGSDRLELFEYTVDWAGGSATITGPVSIPVAAFDSALCGAGSTSCIPQNGGPALDPLAEVPMWRLQYRNFGTHETLVGNFSVDADGSDTAGVRWFELRKSGGGSWALHQQGTYAPQDGGADEHRWMGSAAMDAAGNIAVGYSLSSSATVPQIRYAGRCASDTPGTLPLGERSIHPGLVAENLSRWGDYSSLNVDPVDGATFWYTNDYVRPGTFRQSRIATFLIDCTGAPVCGDGIVTEPEGCDPPAPASCNCCDVHTGGGCTDPACESAVCAVDSFCCTTEWDSLCADQALADPACGCCDVLCEPYCGVCGDGILTPPEECDDQNNAAGDGCGPTCLSECGNGSVDGGETCDPPGPIGSDCCEAHVIPGCSDTTCEATICGADSFCCNTEWDEICAAAALSDPQCAGSCLGAPNDAPYSGNCCDARLGEVGCSDPTCESVVCAADSFCCTTEWDDLCAGAAVNTFPVECAPNCLPLLAECGAACTFCGDGNTDPGETCDDDNGETGDGCRPDCTAEVCGDSILDPGEECEPPGSTVSASDCCENNGTPSCSIPGCVELVCTVDPFCCNVSWDGFCASEALAAGCCPGLCQGPACCVDSDGDGTCDAADTCVLTPNPVGSSDCCTANGTPGCTDPACEATICAIDPFCCSTEWDDLCAGEALRDPGCLAGCGGAIFAQTILATDKTTFAWGAPADIVTTTGPLSTVSTYTTGSGFLYATGYSAISIFLTPPSGEGTWLLVRPWCPGGSWSSGGAGECAGAGCPLGNRDVILP